MGRYPNHPSNRRTLAMMGTIRTWPVVAGLLVAEMALAPPAGVRADTLMEWTIPTPRSQPHDIISDEEGIIWFTEMAADQIGRFDPTTEEFLEFPIPTPGAGPHGICNAPDNGIWFTEQSGNKIGRIDRSTFAIDEVPLPTPGSGAHTPIYDGFGRIWFTQQIGNRIGRLSL